MDWKHFAVRDWVYVAVFGALWGALEITLGAYLHVLFPPMADTFLIGVIMAGIGAIIALTGRYFVPHTGSLLAIGIITAVLKVVSLGGMKTGPIVAILAESLLMELTFLGRPSEAGGRYVLAGVLAVSWNFFHKFVMSYVIFGSGITKVYVKMIHDGARLLGMNEQHAVLIIVILFLVRVVVGGVSGWCGWKLGQAAAQRLSWA